MSKCKVIIVGLDGLCWNFLRLPYIWNRLVILKKLLDNGTQAVLKSVIPPVSGPAWFSIATGMNPGKTGVFDFLSRQSLRDYKLKTITSRYLKSKALWDLLGSCGFRVGVITFPMLYPVYPVNGFMLSGIGMLEESKAVYPPSLIKEVHKIFGRYETSINYHEPKYDDVELFFKDVNNFFYKWQRLVLFLINKEKWDFLFCVLSITDWVLHLMWRYIDERHPLYESDKASKYKPMMVEIFMKIDNFLGKILETTNEYTKLFIVSDHGFGPNDQCFNQAKWLELKGYLVKKKNLSLTFKDLIYKLSTKTYNHLKLWKFLSLNKAQKITKYVRVSPQDVIDFKNSKAFCLGHTITFGEIYVNKTLGYNYEGLKKKIIYDLTYTYNNISEPIKVTIFDIDKIYLGNKKLLAPDIIFTINDWRCTIVKDFNSNFLFKKTSYSSRHTGSHRLDGIFLAYGYDIRKGVNIGEISIYDLAPTILHIFGLPIPNNMDGRVLTEIFESDSELVKREPTYLDSSYYEEKIKKEKLKYRIEKFRKLIR